MRHLGLRVVAVVLVVLAGNTVLTIAPPAGAGGPGGLSEVAATTATGSGSVVINEFVAGQYVELRNVSGSAVDVGGFELWLCDAGGVIGTPRMAFGPGLAAGETYVIASPAFTGGAPDQTYAGVFPRGGTALLDLADGWVDGVAVVADSPCGEGGPAPECPLASTARDAASTDTGRNATDFACRWYSPGAPN